MKTPNFLKGPWNVLPPDAEHPYYRIRATYPGARYKIVNVLQVVDGEPDPLAEETKAVADAIGSLPDLYAALEQLLETSERMAGPSLKCNESQSCTGLSCDFCIARAALAKARGEMS